MTAAPVLEMKPKAEVFGEQFVNKTCLLKVAFGLPGIEKRVKKGEKIVKITSGDEALYKSQKIILVSPEFEAVRKLDASFRMWLYSQFTMFAQGVFIVPNELVDPYVEEKIAEFMKERKKLIKLFAVAYPAQAEGMKKRLKKGWNPKDYPTVDVVLARFFFSFNYVSFAAPGQLKNVNPAIWKREAEKSAGLFSEAANEYRTSLRVYFAEMTKSLLNKLTDEIDPATKEPKQKRIHDTAMTKMREWLDTFDPRNVMNDRELKAEVEKVKKLIAGVSTEELRSTDSIRDKVREGLEKVTTKLEGFVEDTPSRKFKWMAQAAGE